MSESEFLPDLAKFKWPDRKVFIVFDSDIATKPRVEDAEDRLARELSVRGALVGKVRLPGDVNGDKCGLDDFLLSHNVDELEGLLDLAELDQDTYERPKEIWDILETDYPTTEWVWKDFILKGEVNLLYGDGGVGKSLLALHLAFRVALGDSFLERRTTQMPVLCLFSEDGEAEIHRRSMQICKDVGVRGDDDLPIRLWCQPGDETLLANITDTGEVRERPRLNMLCTELARLDKPALVILDSLADLFAINESLRLPVNAAMKRVLGRLCRDYGASVLVLAHPSKTSMLDRSHYSGSTAFNNAVRQRLTLKFSEHDRNTLLEALPSRTLSVAKSNYGSSEEVCLWYYGCSISAAPKEHKTSHKLERKCVLSTILGLIDQGIRVVNSNGNRGDARTLRDLSRTIKSKHNIEIPWQRLKEHLTDLCDEGQLVYIPSDDSKRPKVKARFAKGAKCR